MYEIVVSGGWLMMPILLCSMVSVAIIIERFWSLSGSKILPPGLLRYVWDLYKTNKLGMDRIIELRSDSPLGEVFSAGFVNQAHGREVMKDAMEEAGSKVAHEMERFLAALGTIAAVAPLLGLLGTVIGMIEVFSQIMISGTGDTGRLAGGISTALITTAAGLTVAIPSMIFHRYFERQIDGMVVDMEHQCSRLVDAIYSGKALSETVDEASADVGQKLSADVGQKPSAENPSAKVGNRASNGANNQTSSSANKKTTAKTDKRAAYGQDSSGTA